MIRSVLLLSVSLLAVPLIARAQSPASPGQTQLDRIEGKLDEVLRWLDQAHSERPAAGQGQAAPPGVSNPSPALAGSASGEPSAAYKPGALVVVHSAPKDVNSLSEIPADNVGGFVYQGGPIALTDIRTRGVRYSGPVGAEIQGWLKAKEAGRYQIGTDLNAYFGIGTVFAPTCFLQAWLEGRSLDQRSVLVSHPGSNNANASLVLGAELQPGLYRLRVWSTCTAPEGITTTSELLLKAPSELNLRPVTGSDILHREE